METIDRTTEVDREICRRNFDGLRCIPILLFERSRTERQCRLRFFFLFVFAFFLSFFLNTSDFWELCSTPSRCHRFLDLSAGLTSSCTMLSRSRTPTAARSSPCRTPRPRTSSRFSAAARGSRSAI